MQPDERGESYYFSPAEEKLVLTDVGTAGERGCETRVEEKYLKEGSDIEV